MNMLGTCLFDFYGMEDTRNRNLTEFIFADMSPVPYQIIGKDKDYEFTQMPDVSEKDNKQILKGLVDIILNDGKDILVRDLSVLGFPTLSIAVPGMSEESFDPEAKYFNVFVTMQSLLKDMSKINLSNIKDVIKMMEIIVNDIGYEKISILISLKDNNMLPCEKMGMGAKYFLAICYIMNEQYEKAAKILEDLNFIADGICDSFMEKIMIKSVYYYACAMDKLKDHNKAMYYIDILFDKDVARCIELSFSDRANILLNHYGLEKEDYVENDDSYYLPFMKKLREAQRDNVIDQMSNMKIFE